MILRQGMFTWHSAWIKINTWNAFFLNNSMSIAGYWPRFWGPVRIQMADSGCSYDGGWIVRLLYGKVICCRRNWSPLQNKILYSPFPTPPYTPSGSQQLLLLLSQIVGNPQLSTVRLLSTQHPCVNWLRNPRFVEKKAINTYQSKSSCLSLR